MTFPATPLPARFELDLDGSGAFATDITAHVYTRDDVQITRGRAEESSAPEPSKCTLTINNRSGDYSPRNPVGQYYGQLGRNTALRVSIDSATSWFLIDADTGATPGAGCSATTPDTAALDITGDIDLRLDADFDSWRGTTVELVSKWQSGAAQQSYMLALQSTGVLRLYYSTTGSDFANLDSTMAVPVTTGRLAVRATLDVDNGAAGKTATFYIADTISGTWEQLGDPVTTAGTISIFSGSANLAVADNPQATTAANIIRGRIFAAQVRNGIGGTIVANPDFTAQTAGAASFADSAGRTWTMNGIAAISATDIRYVGEVAQWPVRWDLSEKDIYTQVEANGVLRRMQQGSSALKSVLRRAITSLAHPAVAYWPCEDESGSTTIASGLPGGLPMHFRGTPGFGSDSTFAASEPIIGMGESQIYGYVPAYTSGTSSHQVRFLINVPAAGITSGAVLCRVDCAGTASRWEIVYSTGSGGLIQLTAYDNTGTSILSTSPFVFNMDGVPLRFSFSLQQSGSDVLWDMRTARLGVALGNVNATLSGRTVTRITKVTMGPTTNLGDASIGHIVVQDEITSNTQFLAEMQAYDGEVAGRRVQRLCSEEGVPFQPLGNLDDSTVMGPQRSGKLIDLLNQCATADFGILHESRVFLGLAYRPRSSFQNSRAAATVPYTSLSDLEPTEDDTDVVNDVTATRIQGSAARRTLDAGRLSTQKPPAGVGVYDTQITYNVETDGQLPDQAGWRLRLGTWDEERYPQVLLQLAAPAFTQDAAQTLAARSLDLGDRLVITGAPPARTSPGDISQLVQGFTETLQERGHLIVARCSPEEPWRVGIYAAAAGPGNSKYSSDGTTLGGSGATTTSTSWSIVTPSGPLWTTDPAEFPLLWLVTGELISVTSITGTSSPQTATVVRSVNGVVKTHAAGEVIDFYQPAVYAL